MHVGGELHTYSRILNRIFRERNYKKAEKSINFSRKCLIISFAFFLSFVVFQLSITTDVTDVSTSQLKW